MKDDNLIIDDFIKPLAELFKELLRIEVGNTKERKT